MIGLVVGVVLLVAAVAFLCWCVHDVGYDRGWAFRPPRADEEETDPTARTWEDVNSDLVFENDRPGVFSIAAKQHEDAFTAWVYLASEEVFTYTEPVEFTPAGIDDFAAIAFRRFCERLNIVLAGLDPAQYCPDWVECPVGCEGARGCPGKIQADNKGEHDEG